MLSATDIHLARGGQLVLGGVSVSVGPRSRIGLVGPNGVGKTTFLGILAGSVTPDRGRVDRAPAGMTVGLLPQEREARGGEDVRAFLARRTGVAAAEAAFDALTERLASDASEATLGAYSDALDTFLALGGDDFDARLGAVLDDVGLPVRALDVEVGSLSGGQQARASLAALLLSRFDVFLLDEPTNDLDFAGLDRLERFLAGLAGGVVVVSHDRAFLDATIDRVLEIEPGTKRAAEHAGTWSDWQAARDLTRRQASAGYEAYVGERSRLRQRLQSQRTWAVTGVAKAKKSPKDNDKKAAGFSENRTEKLAGKVKITERTLERLERDAVDKPFEPWELKLSFGDPGRSGDDVCRLDGAVVHLGTPPRGFVLGPVDLDLGWQDRVVVTGPNGGGKSTLLAALLGTVDLASGSRRLGPGVVVGTLDQSRAMFCGPTPTMAAFTGATGLEGSEPRSLLAKLGLGADHIARAGADLSPGERTRAMLGVLVARGVNLVVLDEPTNHLDVEAIEQLELALDAYAGTLVVVTHDRRLLESLRITRQIEVVNGHLAG